MIGCDKGMVPTPAVLVGRFPGLVIGRALANRILFFVCMLSTFLIGTVASIILLLPLLLPLANLLSISPWIIAFVITVGCEAWFLPYQSTYQLYFEELTENDRSIAFASILKMNLIFIPCRLAGLLLSVGYWRVLGLL